MTAPNPIKVFISSAMGSAELVDVRARIKHAIEETGLFCVYLFEEQGASSTPAELDYLLGVDEADVCVFFVESGFGLTEGVRQELDLARSLEKKCLYYFYKQNAEDLIPLQKELRGADQPHTFEVKSLDELPLQIASDLVGDIQRLYRHVGAGFDYRTLVEGSMGFLIGGPTWDDAIVGKAPISDFPKTKSFFAEFAFGIRASSRSARQVVAELSGESMPPAPVNDLDECCSLFLDVILGSRSMKGFNVALLHELLDAYLPAAYANVAKARWRGIQCFYLGDIQGAFDRIKEALEIAEGSAVAEWLIDDLLIDLRNLDAELRGSIGSIDEYQERLSDKDKPLVYPVIDRLNSDMYSALIDESYKVALRPTGTVVMFEDVTRFLDGLAGLAIVSMLYGSFTYIRLIPSKLRRIAYIVDLKYQSTQLERLMLKLALVEGQAKDACNLMNGYGVMLCGLTADEADESFRFVRDCAFGRERDTAILEAFAIYGSYMNDEAFDASLADIRVMVGKALEDNPRPGSTLSAVANNAPRIADKEWLANVCVAAIERGEGTFWREAGVKMLASVVVELEGLGQDAVERVFGAVEACITNDGLVADHLTRALVLMRRKEEYVARIDALAGQLSPTNKASYALNHPDCGLVDLRELANSGVERICKDNETQGRDGAYSYGTDEYLAVEYALEVGGDSLEDVALAAVDACFDTLRATRQLMNAKYNSLRLLAYLSGFSSACEKIADEICALEIGDGDVGRDVMLGGPYEPKLVRACFAVLKTALTGLGELDANLSISAMYRANGFCQIKFAEFIGRLGKTSVFEKSTSLLASRLVSFLMFMCEGAVRDVHVSAFRTLCDLLCDDRFAGEIAELFLASFSYAEPRIKHIVLNALEEHPERFGSDAEWVWRAAGRDPNYFIRVRARRLEAEGQAL